jgi:hypothetical protein
MTHPPGDKVVLPWVIMLWQRSNRQFPLPHMMMCKVALFPEGCTRFSRTLMCHGGANAASDVLEIRENLLWQVGHQKLEHEKKR